MTNKRDTFQQKSKVPTQQKAIGEQQGVKSQTAQKPQQSAKDSTDQKK